MPGRRINWRRATEQLEWTRAARAAHYFVFDHGGLVTKDEHDLRQPVKPIPPVPYLRVLLDLLCLSGHLGEAEASYARAAGLSEAWLHNLATSRILVIEKSRQMLVTWMVCAYLLWRAKFFPHQLILVQSKREDDAANLVFNKEPNVARLSFLESHLPRSLRSCEFPRAGAYGHLYFPNGSHIWAIPEGGDIIRSNTPSVVFSDESAFQPEFGASYTAALPAIKGGGQYIAVSSAEPGEFQQLVEAA